MYNNKEIIFEDMRGPYVIMNSKSQIVGFGYNLWNTNEEAIKNLSEQYETIKKVLDESYNTKNVSKDTNCRS